MTNQDTIETFEVEELLQKQDSNAKEVEAMIQKHEEFKMKWLRLNEQDLFDWVALWEEMECKAIELKSLFEEEKAENDVKKWERLIELKLMLDWNGKKIHTDSTADAHIKKEFKQRESEISIHKLQANQLLAKATKVENYINIVKIRMKKDFTM